MAHDPRIFLSAVTVDFGLQPGESTSVIDTLARAVHDLRCVCIHRYNLFQGADILPQKLRDEIAACDAVVHLVGPRFGFGPRDVETGTPPAEALWQADCRTWWQIEPFPSRRSFTQMELDFALGQKKPVFVFFVDDPALINQAAAQSPEEALLQSEHRRAIHARGHEYAQVASADTLALLAEKLPLAIDHLKRQITARDEALDRAQVAAETHGHRNFRLIALAAAVLLVASGALWWKTQQTEQANASAHAQTVRKLEQEKVELKQQIDKLSSAITDLSRDLKGQKRELSDLSNEEYYAELSKRSGLKPEEIKTVLTAAKNSKDLRTQAEALLVTRQNDEARAKFKEALEADLAAAAANLAAAKQLQIDAVRSRRGMGIAAFNKGDYRQSADDLRSALSALDPIGGRTAEPQLWAQIQHSLADALQSFGPWIEPEEGNRLLAEAITAYRCALEVYTKKDLPQEWAMIQNNLGNVLKDQANRVHGQDSLRLFTEAVASYRLALEVQTKKDFPQDWAMTQNNLANTLREQSSRTEGQDSSRLLTEAIAAHRSALEVRTKKDLPQKWAKTQNGLGSALQDQAKRAQGEDSLRFFGEAVAAYRSALEIYTQKDLPQDWAMTQNNLGITLKEQANRVPDEGSLPLLAEAVTAFRAALEVYTKKDFPPWWATLQNNLGNALKDQANRAPSEDAGRLYTEAIAAYHSALEVRTKKDLPQDWASTQNNLGIALRRQASRAQGEDSLQIFTQSVAAFRSALEVYTQKEFPQDWAMAQNNLGNTLSDQASRARGNDSLRLFAETVAAYRAALEVYTKKEFPQDWARLQHALGNVLYDVSRLANREQGFQFAAASAEAYENALTVYSEKLYPDIAKAVEVGKLRSLTEAAFHAQQWKSAVTGYELFHQAIRGDRHFYQRLSYCYHEGVHDYAKAFALHQEWLRDFPEDRSTPSDFTESHLVTGRFDEAVTRARAVQKAQLTDTGVTQSDSLATHAAMRVIELASLAAQGKMADVYAALATFEQELRQREADFQLSWTWTGTRHYLETSTTAGVVKHRTWLLALIDAADAENRDAILAKVRALPALPK